MRAGMWCLFAVIMLLIIGCNGSGDRNPVEPAGSDQSVASIRTHSQAASESNRYLWGVWEVRVAADHQSVEIAPQRVTEMHLNAVRLLEVAPCKDCLTINNLTVLSPNEFEADVNLRHPFPGLLQYTAFDVRGIFISGGDYIFPESYRRIAWGDDYPRMIFPDGYTSLFNPTEFPETTPPALGYIHGKGASGGDLTATLNPFAAYGKDAPRRMFEAGGEETRTVHLRVPAGPIEFGYAVDACWQVVDGEVIDPVEDFPPDANCLEPYEIRIQVDAGLENGGGFALIHAEVFDHQGSDTIDNVLMKCPDLFNGVRELTYYHQTSEGGFLYGGYVQNELEAGYGEYPLLVEAISNEFDQNFGPVNAYNVKQLNIKKGWARTWGSGARAFADEVALDANCNIYVLGRINAEADLDPGPLSAIFATNGSADIYVSRFDPVGRFERALTWGGPKADYGKGIAADGSGNTYVCGKFYGTVDFDPGPGVDEHEAPLVTGDCFLSKFDSDGNFQWAHDWHANAQDVCVDFLGNVYVTGEFSHTVDFDPGQGVDEHTAVGSHDAFLSKFDSDGNFSGAVTWGGEGEGGGNDGGRGVASDGAGNIYCTGYFSGEVDFDPGPGFDQHATQGVTDAFLSKFGPNGAFQWARTWGGLNQDWGLRVTADNLGNAYCLGFFMEDVDFDPGPGTDLHTSVGGEDTFVSKFSSDGEFQWARTWGGVEVDFGWDLSAGDSGAIYVTGMFSRTVDFDPGPGVDEHTASGMWNVFLSKLGFDGQYHWARRWGGGGDSGFGVGVDFFDNAYVAGVFDGGIVDFDPGPGTDYHEGWYGASFLSKFPPDGNW